MMATTASRPAPRLSIVATVSGARPPEAAVSPAFAASSANSGNGAQSSNQPVSLVILFLQPFDSLARADNVRQPDTELLIHHDHLTVGDQGAIDQHIQWLARQPVQFDHRALVQLEQIAYRNLGVAHFHGDGDGDIQDHVDVRRLATTSALVRAKLLHGSGAHVLVFRFRLVVATLSLSHGRCPLVFPGAFGIARLVHCCFPLGRQLFVFAEFLLVFLVVVSHCVPPSVVSLPWATWPGRESSAPVYRRGCPALPCRLEYHWRSPSGAREFLPESHHRLSSGQCHAKRCGAGRQWY